MSVLLGEGVSKGWKGARERERNEQQAHTRAKADVCEDR